MLQFVVAPLHAEPLQPEKRRQLLLLFLPLLFLMRQMLQLLLLARVCPPWLGC